MAGEWGSRGVRVNAIAPGVTKTAMWDASVARGVLDEPHYLATVPAGRLARTEEVGQLASFLCSDEAAYINGETVTIDGGLTVIPSG
jgi:3-oxoacyl-[acyl-carrier protein] reductase